MSLGKVYFFLIFFSFAFSLKAFSQVCSKNQLPANLQQGLIAYYPFCANYNDISGNNFNGVTQGGAVPFVTDRLGNPNGAVQLGGGFITTSPAVFNFQRNQSFSVSIWFTKDNNAPSGRLLSTECPEGNFRIGASFNGVYAVQYGDYIFDTVNIGQWNHLVYTYENRNEKIYVNGILKYTNNDLSTETLNFCSPFTIGAKASSAFDRWIGKADDIAIYNRVLTDLEVKQLFSNATCSGNFAFNVFNDTTYAIGVSTTLDAGAGFVSYQWSTGSTLKNIEAKASGVYKVTVTDQLGCTASDSTYLNLFCAQIQQNDTTVCAKSIINLSIDTSFRFINYGGSSLPLNLKNDLVAYYPFNGNTNDESGNGNNLINYNAVLTSDRLGTASAALAFSPTSKSSLVASRLDTTMKNTFTYSAWVRPLNPIVIPVQGQNGYEVQGQITNTCVIHPIHGVSYGNESGSAGSGLYVGTNGLYVEEHSANWEAVPISYQGNLSGWHLIHVVYDNKVPSLYIDGKFVKTGVPSSRNIYASLGQDQFPAYTKAGIGAGYPDATQFFNGDIDEVMYFKRALFPSEINNVFSGFISVKWSTGDTTGKIQITPAVTTKYYVTLSDGITTCTDSILVKVDNLSSFNPLPDTISKCGNAVVLDAGLGFKTYTWSNGTNAQTLDVKKAGAYFVNIESNDGCTASDTTFVSLVNAEIIQPDTIICTGGDIKLQILNLQSTSNLQIRYLWSTGDTTANIILTPTQKTKVYVTGTDGISMCRDSVTVDVQGPTSGLRYPTLDVIVNRPTELRARDFGRIYQWSPDQQLNSSRIFNPILTAKKEQQYIINITTQAGCVTVDTLFIRVFPDRNIYVPEGFTPDADGRNDRLYPILVGIKELKLFRIFNRWGTLLYDNRNVNIGTGWDGTYLGNPQPMESYVWVAEGIDIDGKFIRRTGNTILIR